tara:strand:+ start:384 stop:596 length:213 start_codon:yes stop_codon:yes gene_type:complete
MKKGSLVKVLDPVCMKYGVIPEGTYGMCVDNFAEPWLQPQHRTTVRGKIILFLKEGVRVELMRQIWIEKV